MPGLSAGTGTTSWKKRRSENVSPHDEVLVKERPAKEKRWDTELVFIFTRASTLCDEVPR